MIIKRPFHTGRYLQRGSGVFSWLGGVASRYLFPFLSKTAKFVSSGATKAAKSKAVKRLVKHAKKAATEGVIDTASNILDGKDVGTSLKESAETAKKTIGGALKTELNIAKRSLNPKKKGGKKSSTKGRKKIPSPPKSVKKVMLEKQSGSGKRRKKKKKRVAGGGKTLLNKKTGLKRSVPGGDLEVIDTPTPSAKKRKTSRLF